MHRSLVQQALRLIHAVATARLGSALHGFPITYAAKGKVIQLIQTFPRKFFLEIACGVCSKCGDGMPGAECSGPYMPTLVSTRHQALTRSSATTGICRDVAFW